MVYDLAIVGAGPAGSAAAIVAARAGLKVLVLERAFFPREKPCGDCLNPTIWPVLERLGVAEMVRSSPGMPLRRVVFGMLDGKEHCVELPHSEPMEFAIKRSVFDQVLANAAENAGAHFQYQATLRGILTGRRWELETSVGTFRARGLIGADGRNSSVAGILGCRTRHRDTRVAFQTHAPLKNLMEASVQLHLHKYGYAGLADLGSDANVCIVSKPRHSIEIRKWAQQRFGIPATTAWRSITPIARSDMRSNHPSLLLAGDARRVVEPFTGEGIHYAVAGGEAAGNAFVASLSARHRVDPRPAYEHALESIYGTRLWWNQLAWLAVTWPSLGSILFRLGASGGWLDRLTSKVASPRADKK